MWSGLLFSLIAFTGFALGLPAQAANKPNILPGSGSFREGRYQPADANRQPGMSVRRFNPWLIINIQVVRISLTTCFS
jgi:hypothetical protein